MCPIIRISEAKGRSGGSQKPIKGMGAETKLNWSPAQARRAEARVVSETWEGGHLRIASKMKAIKPGIRLGMELQWAGWGWLGSDMYNRTVGL